MSLLNYYYAPLVTTTNFLDCHLIFGFIATGGVIVSTTGGAIFEYSFDGINPHGELRTDYSLDQSKTFYNREATQVYFRLRADYVGGSGTCRAEAWSL